MKTIITAFTICLIMVLNTNMKSQIITTVVDSGANNVGGAQGFAGDGGQAKLAKLYNPKGVFIDAVGNMYIADTYNQRIRKVNTAGIISTMAGNGTLGYTGDNAQATLAELNNPCATACDASGNLYIADYGNNIVRKVLTAQFTGGISTFVGYTNAAGYAGDGAQATTAKLNGPSGIAFDAVGNLYIADCNNNRIRKVNTSGIITTIVNSTGNSGFSGDGVQATAAKIYKPTDVKLDAVGNLYIADSYNNRIRKVNTAGIISTYVGNGTGGYTGNGGQATAAEITSIGGNLNIVIDKNGNLYLSDVSATIREVNTLGIINIIAGNGTQGYSGNGGQATAAKLYTPNGLACDSSGNLYEADALANCIRMISAQLTISINSPTICAGATATLTANGAVAYTWNTGAMGTFITDSPTLTTTYSVTGTDNFIAYNIYNVSTGTATTIVTVNATPTVSAVSDSSSLCLGNTATLTAGGATTYTWSTNAITASIAITPTVTTNYTVTGSSANGCVNTTTVTQVVTNCNTTDIDQHEFSTQINIYPNPSNGYFNVNAEEATVTITDCLGRTISITKVNGTQSINVPDQGVYIIQIVQAGKVFTQRLINK